jgi:hypothetical protein
MDDKEATLFICTSTSIAKEELGTQQDWIRENDMIRRETTLKYHIESASFPDMSIQYCLRARPISRVL